MNVNASLNCVYTAKEYFYDFATGVNISYFFVFVNLSETGFAGRAAVIYCENYQNISFIAVISMV